MSELEDGIGDSPLTNPVILRCSEVNVNIIIPPLPCDITRKQTSYLCVVESKKGLV